MTNHTDKPLRFGENIRPANGEKEVYLLEPNTVHASLKQNSPVYLLYLLLSFVNVYVEDNGQRTTYPVGLALGPGIGIGNMAVAGSANGKFKRELLTNHLTGRETPVGQTVYGLIGVSDRGYNPLTIKLSDQ
jgi:hypothetical protein